MSFADGTTALLESGPDGEVLIISDQPLRDPFGSELSKANREYVRQHGKWTAFDVSDEAPYDELCGHVITDVHAIRLVDQLVAEGLVNAHAATGPGIVNPDKVVGAVLQIGGRAMRAESVMDELRVTVELSA